MFQHIFLPCNFQLTDGQIFLESSLFNSGVRPAINVGIFSYPGWEDNAQIKAMKRSQNPESWSGTISWTGSILQIWFRSRRIHSGNTEQGAKKRWILKQGQYAPIPIEKQIAIIYCGTMGLLKDVPINKVKSSKANLLSYLNLNTRYSWYLVKVY